MSAGTIMPPSAAIAIALVPPLAVVGLTLPFGVADEREEDPGVGTVGRQADHRHGDFGQPGVVPTATVLYLSFRALVGAL